MKKLLISLMIFTVPTTSFVITENWTPISQEQAESNYLMQQCAQIAEYFTMLNASSSSDASGAIFQYLKNVGTPASLGVLKAQIAIGRVPAHYLNLI